MSRHQVFYTALFSLFSIYNLEAHSRRVVVVEGAPIVYAAPQPIIVQEAPVAYVAASPLVTVQEAPPAEVVEVVPASPGENYAWLKGSWKWEGRWVWHKGYWGPRPHPEAYWKPGHWSATHHGWSWREGHWH